MTYIRLACILSFGALAASASAAQTGGNRVGNGGDAVLCGGISPRAEILDFEELPGAEWVKVEEDDTPEKIVLRRIEVLEKNDPKLAQAFRRRIGALRSEIEFRSDVLPAPVDDSFQDFVPVSEDCRFAQAALRRAWVEPGQKRFLFDERIWKQLRPRSQAGLIAHEIVYEYFAKIGETDSRKARAFNRLLFQTKFENWKPADYWKWIREQKLPIYPEG